jgi:hypothetical protein
MDWIVAVSADEVARGELSPESERDAHAAFREHGCVLLRGAFPRPAVEAMFDDYVARYGALNAEAMQNEAAKPPPNRYLRVGEARYEITLRVSGALGALDTIANRLLLRFLNPLLGDDMLLSGLTMSSPIRARRSSTSIATIAICSRSRAWVRACRSMRSMWGCRSSTSISRPDLPGFGSAPTVGRRTSRRNAKP